MKLKKHLPALWLLPVLLVAAILTAIRLHPISAPSSDQTFEAFTRELFCQDVSANTLTLHYTLKNPAAYGITQPSVTFGNYVPGSAGHGSARLQEILSELQEIPYENLNSGNRLTYDILEAQLTAELQLAPYGLYEEIFGPTLGTQAQLPVLLTEYSFETLDDVDVYLELLSQLDSYYESLLVFQREKAAVGLFMWEDTAEKVIDGCQSFIENPEENFLITTFEDRISNLPFLSLEQKKSYLESNTNTVMHSVIPAYERLIDGLSSLKGCGKNSQGLCYYEHGQDYYQALIAATIGSQRNIPEIQDLLNERMNTDFEIISDLLHENPSLSGEASTNKTDTLYIEASASGSASPATSVSLSSQMLETLEQRILTDFPAVSPVEYHVKQVHPSMEQHLSPAFYLTPPLDDAENHTIYINDAANYDAISLFTTLAHEGYPGHLYQSLWENAGNPNPALFLFYFGGYSEGWATYAERQSYSYAGLDPDVAELLAANNSISLGIYAQADIGIHYEGWSLAQTAAFLTDFGITSEVTARNIYQAVLEAPANYLKYYLGYVEIEKLREQANAALGESFDLKEFHTFILSTGPAPFPVLEKYMEKWIQEQV